MNMKSYQKANPLAKQKHPKPHLLKLHLGDMTEVIISEGTLTFTAQLYKVELSSY